MIFAVWRWGLPFLGLRLPLSVLIVVMAVLATYAVVSFQVGSRALRKKPVVGLTTMEGGSGKVVRPLNPEGMVMVEGELWEAKSVEGNIAKGEEVIVVGQDGLKLTVRKSKH